VVVGMIVAIALVAAAELISHFKYPPPPGLDLSDTAAVKAWVATLPAGSFMLVLVGWTLGALAGPAAAILIERRARTAGLIVGALFLAATLYNVVSLPSPTWFRIAGMALVIAGPIAAVLMLSRGPGPKEPLAQG
jgi:hypothetical protein